MNHSKAILKIIFLATILFNVLFCYLFYKNELRDFKAYADRASKMLSQQIIEFIEPYNFTEHNKLEKLSLFLKKNAKSMGLLNIKILDEKDECIFTIHSDDELPFVKEPHPYTTEIAVQHVINKKFYNFMITLDMANEYNAAFQDVKIYTGISLLITILFFAVFAYIMQFFSKKQEQYIDIIEEQQQETLKLSKIKENFLNSITHELRTPMNGFLGVLELLENTKLQNKQKQLLDTALFSAKHLQVLLNDILDLNKIENEQLKIEEAPFPLIHQMKKLLSVNASSCESKKIDLIFESDISESRWVKSDVVRIHQILQNLLSNAIKFTQKGFVKLTIKEEKSGFFFIVEDTGIGIELSDIDKIFDPYTSITHKTIQQYGGTGLGLSITKKIISQLNGSIHVRSTLKKGSTFTVFLPLKIIEEPIVYSEKMNLSYQILVVDDHHVNQFILKTFLEKKGHHVTLASSGAEAISLIYNHVFDIIFMDIQMPEIDGFQTALKIREYENHLNRQKTKIIACSANELDSNILKKYDFDDQLSKPIDSKKIEKIFLNLESLLY
jgi:signal transduction histidine kinase